MLVGFGLLLLWNMVNRVPQFIQENTGIDLGAPYLIASASLSDDTPHGTRVSALGGGDLMDNTGMHGTSTGTVAPGTSLVIIGGPDTVLGGVRWWQVEDPATGRSGWMPESALVREGAGGVGAQTPIGTKARAIANTALWRLPGTLDKVGDMAKGTTGTITDGPTSRTGTRWWFFDREESEEDGWVPESALVLASDADWRAGSRVRATRDLDLFERPGGGRVLGSAVEDDALRVVSGPMQVGGEYWWLVETADDTQGWVPESALKEGGVRGWFKGVVATALVVAVVFTTLLVGGILYAAIRTGQIRAREARRIREAIPSTMQPRRNERWDKVVAHVSSENPNDWRLAIIEADIMLDEMVTRMGFMGNTLGDKLKQATRGDFRSLDNAWEAHRVRNQIAHEGSDFILTQREAKRVIGLYESVFEEFKYS